MKLKKTIAILGLGIGVSLSVGAFSVSAANNCPALKAACKAGNTVACRIYWRSCLRG